LAGLFNTRGGEKSHFSTNSSLYLNTPLQNSDGNVNVEVIMFKVRSHYETLTGSRMLSFKPCDFRSDDHRQRKQHATPTFWPLWGANVPGPPTSEHFLSI